ncbi:MAG: hypothetical protein ACLSH6_07705 [Limosilactobacillus pontis]
MTTRSELRPSERPPKGLNRLAASTEPDMAPEKSHHFFNFWGTIFLILFVLSTILNATILNPKFVLHEVRDRWWRRQSLIRSMGPRTIRGTNLASDRQGYR